MSPASAEYAVARGRCNELYSCHHARWNPGFDHPGIIGHRTRRGFVEAVTLTASALTANSPIWAGRVPLREVTVRTRGRLARLAGCGCLATVRDLRFEYPSRTGPSFGDPDLEAVARNPHLPALDRLALSTYYSQPPAYTAAGIRRLATARFIPHLECLDLPSRGVGAAGVTALVGGGRADRLWALRLGGWGCGDEGAAVLAAVGPPGLADLSMGGCGVGDEGLRALVCSGRMTGLAVLRLPGGDVTADGLQAVCRSRRRAPLRYLDLTGCDRLRVSVADVAEVLKAFRGVLLNLSRCPVPAPVQAELTRRYRWRVLVDSSRLVCQFPDWPDDRVRPPVSTAGPSA